MAIKLNDIYTIQSETTGLEFLQLTRIKLEYVPVSSVWSIRWKLVSSPHSIGNPLMLYTFDSGLETSYADNTDTTHKIEYLTLLLSGTYKIEVEENVDGHVKQYELVFQSNALNDRTTAPFPWETTEVDENDGYMRKIEQTIQRLSEKTGSLSVIGVNHDVEFQLGQCVVVKGTEFIENIVPAGHIWEIENVSSSVQDNSVVGIIVEKNEMIRFGTEDNEIFYKVAFRGNFNLPISLPEPLASLGETGGSFYYDPSSKSVKIDYNPNYVYWGKYITVAPTEEPETLGYNVISLENLAFLNYPDGDFNTSFSLKFSRHDGTEDVKWTSFGDPIEGWEISFFHGLDSNNLIVEVWKEPSLQSDLNWERVSLDAIIKDDENHMTIRISEIDPTADPTSDFNGRINIINLNDVSETKPNGLFWSMAFSNGLSDDWEDRYTHWILYDDGTTETRRRYFHHNFNNSNLFVQVWNTEDPEGELVVPHTTFQVDPNELFIEVPLTEEFAGKIIISSNLTGSPKTFISLLDTPNSYGSPGQIPVMNSSGTGLTWSSSIGLWKYQMVMGNNSLVPIDNSIKWCAVDNFRGKKSYMSDYLDTPLVKTRHIHFHNPLSLLIHNNSIAIIDAGDVDDITEYGLFLRGKDTNSHGVLTMRHAVTDLSVGPIDDKHWATTAAIKGYIDTLTPAVTNYLGLPDTFQETTGTFTPTYMLVTKSDGIHEEHNIRYRYEGQRGTYDKNYLELLNSNLKIGDGTDDSVAVDKYLLTILRDNEDNSGLFYCKGSGSEGSFKIYSEMVTDISENRIGQLTLLFENTASQTRGIDLSINNDDSYLIFNRNNDNGQNYIVSQRVPLNLLFEHATGSGSFQSGIKLDNWDLSFVGSKHVNYRTIDGNHTIGSSDDVVIYRGDPDGGSLHEITLPSIDASYKQINSKFLGRKITIINRSTGDNNGVWGPALKIKTNSLNDKIFDTFVGIIEVETNPVYNAFYGDGIKSLEEEIYILPGNSVTLLAIIYSEGMFSYREWQIVSSNGYVGVAIPPEQM